MRILKSRNRTLSRTRWALLACGLMSVTTTGCLQSTIGGQTLPSAYYLSDDIQYHPPGPENYLYNETAALERYRLEQAAGRNGLAGDVDLGAGFGPAPFGPAPVQPGPGGPPGGPVAPPIP